MPRSSLRKSQKETATPSRLAFQAGGPSLLGVTDSAFEIGRPVGLRAGKERAIADSPRFAVRFPKARISQFRAAVPRVEVALLSRFEPHGMAEDAARMRLTNRCLQEALTIPGCPPVEPECFSRFCPSPKKHQSHSEHEGGRTTSLGPLCLSVFCIRHMPPLLKRPQYNPVFPHFTQVSHRFCGLGTENNSTLPGTGRSRKQPRQPLRLTCEQSQCGTNCHAVSSCPARGGQQALIPSPFSDGNRNRQDARGQVCSLHRPAMLPSAARQGELICVRLGRATSACVWLFVFRPPDRTCRRTYLCSPSRISWSLSTAMPRW